MATTCCIYGCRHGQHEFLEFKLIEEERCFSLLWWWQTGRGFQKLLIQHVLIPRASRLVKASFTSLLDILGVSNLSFYDVLPNKSEVQAFCHMWHHLRTGSGASISTLTSTMSGIRRPVPVRVDGGLRSGYRCGQWAGGWEPSQPVKTRRVGDTSIHDMEGS